MSTDKKDRPTKDGKPRKKYLSPKLLSFGVLTLSAIQAQATPSSLTVKEDIRPLSCRDHARVLSKLNSLKLYRFRYWPKNKTSKLRMGVLAEEAPREITANGRKALDIGSTLGFIMAAMKAQEERRRALEARLERQQLQIRRLSKSRKSL